MKRRVGLTLIELLVTLTIMALLTVVGIAGYGSSQKKHEVKNAAIELKDVIEKTKRYSLGPRSNSEPDKIAIWGYCFQVKKDTTQWSIKEYYTNSTTDQPTLALLSSCGFTGAGGSFKDVESGRLGSRIKLLNDNTDGFPTYRYKGATVGAGELASDPGSPYYIIIAHQNSNDQNRLLLNKNGTVEWTGS